jgi:NAD(P)-dependent dehydrogenase (short-subunit alcohol dehydrogenase family)
VLVNNAGTTDDVPIMETTAEAMRPIFETNVFGVVTLIHTLLPLLAAAPAPRIVNVSSTTASLGLISNGSDFGGNAGRRLAYTSPKTAVNMPTLQYAAAFANDPNLKHIKINSVTPGYTATDLNDHQGTRSVAEGARIIVELASLPDAGPTGGFFNDHGSVPW